MERNKDIRRLVARKVNGRLAPMKSAQQHSSDNLRALASVFIPCV